MKRVAVLTILLVVAFAAPTSANSVASSTMHFEGSLTDAGGGVYTGTIPMTVGAYYVPGGDGEGTWDQGGFDVYAREGGTAYVQGMTPNSWTIGADHDAYSESGPWGTWYDPDCADYYAYELELTADHWYLRYAATNESPMSGLLGWANMYAAESDLGTQDGAHDGSAAHGGGAGAWDWDCGWGVEVIPLELAGFDVSITEVGGGAYHVTLTPAAPSEVWVDDDFNSSTPGWGITHFDNIQAAINAVSGSTVHVAAGTYAGAVNINKSVTLLGANAGVHPAVGTHPTETIGTRGPESILTNNYPAIVPAADDITIDGFMFTGDGGRIIDTYADANSFHLTNCIFDNDTTGTTQGVIQFGGGSHTGMLLDFNLFQDQGDHTFYAGGGPFDGLTIEYNKFNVAGDSVFWAASPLVDGVIQGNELDGTLGGTPGTGFCTINIGQGGNIAILDNWFHDLQYTPFQVGIIGGSVIGNTIERIYPYPGYWASAFELWGGQWGTAVSTNVTITDNTIHYNDVPGAVDPSHGLRIRAPEAPDPGIDGSTINVGHNSFLNGGARSDAYVVRHQGDPTTTVDAEENYWNTLSYAAISGLMEGNVDFEPWCNSDFSVCGFTSPVADAYVDDDYVGLAEGTEVDWPDGAGGGGHYIGYDAFASIQDGIDAVTASTVYVAAGTYVENIDVNKYVQILGAGSGSDPAFNSIITQTAAGAGDTKIGVIQLSASGLSETEPILIQNIRVEPDGMAGLSVGRFTEATGTTVSYVELDNVAVVGNNVNPNTEQERGLYVDLTSSLSYLTVSDGAFDNLTYGWYFQKEVGADASTVSNVLVTNTTFNHNNLKGIYAEKLTEATFSYCTVSQNGFSDAGVPSYFLPWMSGFDINLKAGTYQNLVFDCCTIVDNALGGAKEGVGLTVKGRGTGDNPSGSYTAFPAYVDGVTVTGGTITGNERGLRFGEPGKQNAGPTGVVIDDVNLYGNVQTYGGSDGSAYGDLVDVRGTSADQIDATGNWWGQTGGPVAGQVASDYLPDPDTSSPLAEESMTCGPPPNSLTFEADDCQDDVDPGTGGVQIEVELWMRNLTQDVTGFQAFVEFDTAELTFVSGTYTGTPFGEHIPPTITADGNEIDLEGHVPAGGPATSDDALLATLVFTVVDECLTTEVEFRTPMGPFVSELSFHGEPVSSRTLNSETIRLDDTPPTIDVCPAVTVVECDGAGNTAALNAWLASFAASDNCGTVTLTDDFTALSDDCGATGSATVTFTATDPCGNETSCTSTFTIEDTTAPSIDTPADDLTVECDGFGNTAELTAWLDSHGGAAASDDCGGVAWSHDFSALSDDCCATGSATVTFTATDDCGLTSTTTATFTIEDTTSPVVSGCPADIVVNADAGECTAVVTWTPPTATDVCCDDGLEVSVVSTHNPGDVFGLGLTTVTYTFEDDCGNTEICEFTVTVNDVNDVDLEVELVGVTVPSSRCIHFVTDDCDTVADVELDFIDHDGNPATPVRFVGTVQVPCGDWSLLCAKDEQHTLFDNTSLTDEGTYYSADYLLSLEPGDTDNDSDVDIHDVTWLMYQWGELGGAIGDGGCPWDGTRDADFDLSGFAGGTTDYLLLSGNWHEWSLCPCTDLLIGLPDTFSVETSLAVKTLPRDVANAVDLNRDSLVDFRDVKQFEALNGLPHTLSAKLRALQADQQLLQEGEGLTLDGIETRRR